MRAGAGSSSRASLRGSEGTKAITHGIPHEIRAAMSISDEPGGANPERRDDENFLNLEYGIQSQPRQIF
jgi:hypothetical protein